MLVMKFGGTSVADAERMRHAARRTLEPRQDVVVVTSAMAGVTDRLIELGESARSRSGVEFEDDLAALQHRHMETVDGVTEPGAEREALRTTVRTLLDELDQLLHGVHLLQEISPRSADLIVSFGERLAAALLAAAIRSEGGPAEAVDARQVVRTTDSFAGPVVDMSSSRELTRAVLGPIVERGIAVVTGFIAAAADGRTTTLGRGGSDYSASLMGAFLDADEIWIWTDVDGVMTADPRVVPEARVLPEITYREAAEMAYFGSSVLHPSTMIPAVETGIPVVIRNSYRPDEPGTRITDKPVPSRYGVKTAASVPALALLTIEGSGMLGVPGVMKRVFSTTARANVNVYLVSQASSEHNISFLVHKDDGPRIVTALQEEFELEMARQQIDRVDMLAPVGTVAIIGEGMKGTPGISQRLFTALGRAHINVIAIAQGSSELNVSVVVREEDLQRAVGAVHSRFGLTRDTHLLVLGKGLVGKTLLRQLVDARHILTQRHAVDLKVIGVAGRQESLLNLAGIDEDCLLRASEGDSLVDLGGEPRLTDAALFERIAASRWLDVIVVDVTAEDHALLHRRALELGFHVVTANKKPMSGPQDLYRSILDEADRRGVGYHFETTFGAGLPALSTLQDLLATADEVRRVTGCFSGTLGFICTALQAHQPFSAAVAEAAARGYMEPDPRDDLNGMDVARKALIIARQLGADMEMADVVLEGLLPDSFMALADVETVLQRLPELDEPFAERVRHAESEGQVLRYIADVTPDRVEVGLRAVDADSPPGQLAGPDNILVFHTRRYDEYPLVIRGPGAGAAVTAAGVLGDVLKIVRAT